MLFIFTMFCIYLLLILDAFYFYNVLAFTFSCLFSAWYCAKVHLCGKSLKALREVFIKICFLNINFLVKYIDIYQNMFLQLA